MRPSTLGALVSTALPLCRGSDMEEVNRARVMPRQLPDPPESNFVRRADAAATVLDGYLYIVGGAVSVRPPNDDDDDDDDDDEEERAQVAGVNVTLALSLKENWKSKDVEYDIIEADNFGKHIGHALWTNEEEDEVVFWGGNDFGGDNVGSRNPKVWTLAADDNGGGEWSSEDPPDDIRRASFGAYTQCGGKGFFVGGYGQPNSDSSFDGDRIAVPGLISYDMKEKTFKNESMEDFTSSGSFQKGAAVCVTPPNDKPKLFVVGGAEITISDSSTDSNSSMLSFDNAYFWDLEKEKWFKQETQGPRPTARQGHCAVGASGPNGTYEIFMYGGFKDGGGALDDVWVLSIPAFRWFEVDAKSDERLSHACARVGSQMIVVGGNAAPIWNKKDSFPKGLGIFSLNTLSWKDSFEANSAEYQGPQEVRNWYSDRGHDTIPWGSDEIKDSFLSTEEEAPEPTESPTDSDSSSDSTPAIVGGVVGGVAALAAVGLGVWFWRRRKAKKARAHQPVEADGTSAMNRDNKWTNASEMDPTPRATPSELDTPDAHLAANRAGKKHPAELPGNGHHAAVELP